MAKSIQMKNKDGEEIYPYALLKEFLLYNNDSGSNGTITLSDSVVNYKYIEIFYSKLKSYYHSVKVYNANNKTVSLITGYKESDYLQIQEHSVKISETAISWISKGGVNLSSAITLFSGSELLIHRVVGYK